MKSARLVLLGGMYAAVMLAVAPSAQAQQIETTGTPGSPERHHDHRRQTAAAARPEIRRRDQGRRASSTPWWPPRVVPPKGAPNVLLIMTDDAGFGVPSTFGGVIPTPTMDRIAARRAALQPDILHLAVLADARRARSPGATITRSASA